MAGTPISEVNDMFMLMQNDYRLLSLYQTSIDNFNQYLEAWALLAIDEFDDLCTQSLAYTPISGSSGGYFTETLTQKHKDILAQIMVKYWLMKTVSDVTQMNLALQDRDYKTFSQAQNLDAKRNYYNVKREEISQLLQDYSYKNNNWANWKNQNFG